MFEKKLEREEIHRGVHILHCHLAVDRLHGGTSVLHGGEGLLVDVGGLDGVDLLLEHGYLVARLLEGLLVLLLTLEGGAGGCLSPFLGQSILFSK